ncbi:ATP phosphoribosyltransferase regulatory subunit [Fictibacillus macauensis ZFHKF-1]|uniref:ATP phosphoribosyltransferase regulatory subunit n=1 Tax=Fictibacillus macauensis ZFHKF-1 TaxID=1196324 RepID=I8J5E7_9BACL|nr:ATP phosphoribosyltransferase regulatory subunit [Fictibacillus macauensis]EIT87011.1 ATP phosphoribosyltransferase regulatory subunit [Fictibacillus macauensis ZFHKF-1]
MTKPLMFEKPVGMRDTLPPLYDAKHNIRSVLMNSIVQWGYSFLQTPALEYYDTVGVTSSIADHQLFKLLDAEGQTLVLRPDVTAPIARVVSSIMKKEPFPLRLAYDSPVYRSLQKEGGRPAEFEQMGVELIGDKTSSADAEIVALMIALLEEIGLRDCKIAIGHVGFVDALFTDILSKEEDVDLLLRYLYEKNYVGYTHHVKNLSLSAQNEQRLLALLELKGGKETLKKAQAIGAQNSSPLLAEIDHLFDVLNMYGVQEKVSFDFSLRSHMSYYTGIIFEGYTANYGFPLCRGGRYDHLLQTFGRVAKAIGFALSIDDVMEALPPSGIQNKQECIIYSPSLRREAYEKAQALRRNGCAVVLQDVRGIDEMDHFTRRFSSVTYMLDTHQEGESC